MKTIKTVVISLAALTFTFALTLPAEAAPVLTNGGFESGFAGWTIADSLGSDGTFFLQSGTASPFNGDPVPAPPGGSNAAMSDGGAPGSHVLYQDFTISSSAGQFLLSFDLFIGNRDGFFASPLTLDFGVNEANQQVRVDIMKTSADPFSVAAGDLLSNLYQSQAGDPLVSGYATYSFDITSLVNANLGNPLRLRFAETDNMAPLQAGVDNVNVATTTVPEPSTFFLLSAGLGGLALFRRKRS
jgi:hypothetical protein